MLFCSPGWKQSTTLLSPNRRPADPPFDRLSAPLCPRPCRPIRQLRRGAVASAAERARRGRHETTFARPSGRVPTHRSRPAPLRRQASGRLNRTMPPPRPVDCFSAIPPSLPPSLPPPPPPPQHLEQPHRLADPARHPGEHPGPGTHPGPLPHQGAPNTARLPNRWPRVRCICLVAGPAFRRCWSRHAAARPCRARARPKRIPSRPALRVSRIVSRQAEPVPEPPAPPAHPLTPRARDTRDPGPAGGGGGGVGAAPGAGAGRAEDGGAGRRDAADVDLQAAGGCGWGC